MHGEFILLTVRDGRKVALNPINIRGVIVDFADVSPRQIPVLPRPVLPSYLRHTCQDSRQVE
jgi:hypothetical protein